MKICLLLAMTLLPLLAFGQAPGVPVYDESDTSAVEMALSKQARGLRKAGLLLSAAGMAAQLDRTSCSLQLPPPQTQKLDNRELWKRARQAHLRIGWYYLCNDCNKWHVDLSGGYAITKDTVCTCGHVIGDGKDEEMREGYLIAVDDDDHVIPVVEVLAVNHATDTAILRLKTDQLKPLPLSTDVTPGDAVVCFSDPIDRRGVFSTGIVERFMKRQFLRPEEMTEEQKRHPGGIEAPVWMQVSTEWAQGSSGSAVLDDRGNAVGHVSEIQTMLDESDDIVKGDAENTKSDASAPPAAKAEKPDAPDDDAPPEQLGTVIVFHDAITAQQVKALIKP